MNIDFGFISSRTHLCLAGWSDQARLAPAVLIDGVRIEASHLARFPRRDLQSEAPLGLLAVFPLRAPPRVGAWIEIAANPGAAVLPFDASRLAGEEMALIGSSVDEIFAAWLRAIACGQLAPPGSEASAAAMARIEGNLAPLPAETETFALAIDRLAVSPGGTGAAIGWCLTDRPVERPFLALACNGHGLRPAGLVVRSLPRADLAGYAGRFHYGGCDGFFCVFRLDAAPEGDTRLVLLGDGAVTARLFARTAAPVGNAEIGDMLCELRDTIANPEDDAALMDMLAPQVAPLPASALLAAAHAETGDVDTAPDAEGRTVLLLAVDVAGHELRDTLRAAAAAIPGRIEVTPLGTVTATGHRAMAAAANEAGGRVTIRPAVDVPDFSPALLDAGTQVVWASAAALFQMGAPERMAGMAVALVHDPLGLLDRPEAPVDDETLRDAARVVSLPSALLLAALDAAPGGLLTAEGMLGAVLWALARAGLLVVRRSPLVTCFPGSGGETVQPRRRHTPASLDAALLARLPRVRPA